ncbi:MAG: ABC transporter substrate-binding protein, partial [Variibacter sp.]|nr:ABC transporter substrate-binding protein [Variibacter sp.]
MLNLRGRALCFGLGVGLGVALLAAPARAQDFKIAHVYDKTGPLEAYAKQSSNGLKLGFEYATGGTMMVNGRRLVLIEKDTQGKPDVGKSMLAEAFGDDDAQIAVGPVSSGVALAMLPVAQEHQKILLVEPAVADSITGSAWNRYIFRTARNSTQDAVSNAVAIGKPGVVVATLAQDYAFGRDGVAAFREALKDTGAKLAFEEYAPTDTQDFTASAQRIFDALKNESGRKILFIIWAGGGNPFGKIKALSPERFGIEIASG